MHLEDLVIDAVEPQRLGRFWPEGVAAGITERGGRELHPAWGVLPWRLYADPSGNESCVLPARSEGRPLALLHGSGAGEPRVRWPARR